jgi:hypothetical protein
LMMPLPLLVACYLSCSSYLSTFIVYALIIGLLYRYALFLSSHVPAWGQSCDPLTFGCVLAVDAPK